MSTLSFMKRRLVGVVTTTDNGGSTGKLRDSHQCIAWGDIRNCLSQLARQPLASDLLDYRFSTDSDLSGHNFGNLLLYTLDELSARPIDGIQLLSRLLKVDNRVLPMSEQPTDLVAETEQNMTCFGEIRIDALCQMPKRMNLSPTVSATPEVIEHIQASDLVILGPGSLLTSVVPPLLVDDIRHAIAQTQAKVIFVDNLVDENSPAGKLSCDERVKWVEQIIGPDSIDAVISKHGKTITHIPVITDVEGDQEAPHRHQQSSLLSAIAAAHQSIDSSNVHWLSEQRGLA
ncbi:uridine diphosphate-N-acetylglucosamine-binding protein YvcK [Lysobacter sp. N42]|nr:uridine diphosphate-N-acetylglucosamine-binding protein YvcK [Aliidiomarina sp. B3213]TCZ93439.1 uridine diphosphate-N-acetylglucosamine-binding protein YvcK [Lysobacter sp. N42]